MDFHGNAAISVRAAQVRITHDRRVSPTVLRSGQFRLFFFSREESRMHVHVQTPDGEAKFWLEPAIALAQNHGIKQPALLESLELIRKNEQGIRPAWYAHFVR